MFSSGFDSLQAKEPVDSGAAIASGALLDGSNQRQLRCCRELSRSSCARSGTWRAAGSFSISRKAWNIIAGK